MSANPSVFIVVLEVHHDCSFVDDKAFRTYQDAVNYIDREYPRFTWNSVTREWDGRCDTESVRIIRVEVVQ